MEQQASGVNCFGPVVELAYTADLKSVACIGLAGSSPAGATITSRALSSVG